MQVWLIPIADERVGVQVKLWNPLRTRAIPERFCDGDSLRSVCTFTFTFTLATENPLDFGGNPDHVTLESGLGSGGGIFPMGGYEISGICLTVKILRHQRPWRRYALYWVRYRCTVQLTNERKAVEEKSRVAPFRWLDWLLQMIMKLTVVVKLWFDFDSTAVRLSFNV